MTTENASQERNAAELVLAVAIKERDDAQARVDWLSGLVARNKPESAGQPGLLGDGAGPSQNGHASLGDSLGEDEGKAGGEPLYGIVRATVHKIFLDALPRKLTMAEAKARFDRLGIPRTAKTSISSVRHAVRALVKSGKLKKVGSIHYKAVTES